MRESLNERRIVAAAARVADRGGLGAVSMRNIGRELGVEAMSLYHHVANKAELLDRLADWIFAQISLPEEDDEWRDGMRRRAASARTVLTRHPWSLMLIDSRANPGPALLRHHDRVIGCLLRGGFTVALAAQAFSVIDAYVYGFALTERNLPFDPETGGSDFAAEAMPLLDDYPHLAALVGDLTATGEYSFSDQFDDGLELILDGLAARVSGGSATAP